MTIVLDQRGTEAQWLALLRPLRNGETAKVINPAGAQYPDLVKYGTGAMFAATPYATTSSTPDPGATITPVAASNVIPLDKSYQMADQAPTVAKTYTPLNAAANGSCNFAVTAVAGVVHDFSALGLLYGDAVSTTAGDVNSFVAYCGLGNRLELSNRVFPTTTVPGDTTAPTINARSVANGTPTVVNLTFTEAMDVTSVPAAGSFTVSGKTVSAFAFIDSTHANVTVSVAFANGVTSTLDYTQPSTGKLKDSAGNLLASFTGATIVNNVAAPGDTTAPTITTRAVQNGTPSVLNLTFSEAMKTSVSPPASAFTVGGHTVSAFAWVDTTHANLTLATPFVNGEPARTLAYTVPSSPNQTQDAAGNWLDAFTGAAIVNNVVAGTPNPAAPVITNMYYNSGDANNNIVLVLLEFAPFIAGANNVDLPSPDGFSTSRNSGGAGNVGTVSKLYPIENGRYLFVQTTFIGGANVVPGDVIHLNFTGGGSSAIVARSDGTTPAASTTTQFNVTVTA